LLALRSEFFVSLLRCQRRRSTVLFRHTLAALLDVPYASSREGFSHAKSESPLRQNTNAVILLMTAERVSTMKFSDVFLYRHALLQRVGYGLMLVATFCVAILLTLSDLAPSVRFSLAVFVLASCLFVLVRWRWMAMKRFYGLTVFPPGGGTLRRLTDSGRGRLLSLVELASRFAWKPGGILLGRPLPEHRFFGLFSHLWVGPPDDRHILTIAGSRGGKGTAALIPNLLVYPGSALVIDPKGELAQITATRRGSGSARVTEFLGQDVFIIDPEDVVVGLSRACWNPLQEFDLGDPHLFGKVQRLGLALVPPASDGEEFFHDWARNFLVAVILHVLTHEPPERRNLIYVRKLLSQGDDELFAMVVAECQTAGVPVPYADAFEATLRFMAQTTTQGGKVAGTLRQLVNMADATRSSVIGTLLQQTSYLDEYSMEKTLQRSDFSLSDLKRRPTTVYICLKGTSLSGPLSRIMYVFIDMAVTAMESVPGKPPFNVLFAMDEFYCLGKNEALDRAMGLVAGFGVTLWPLLQHIGQLKRYYPNTWDNFIRNCRAVQYFGDLDTETLEYLEKRIGETVVRQPDGSEQRRPLLSALEMASSYFVRDSRRALVLFQQAPAAALELIDHYRLLPKHWYEDDPRATDRSNYGGWSGVI
jgi:type IV secretion system protein VirD4